MEIKSVSVELSAKRTENYNSVYSMVGFCADLGEGDDPDEVVRQLQVKCKDLFLGGGKIWKVVSKRAASKS